jgi:hypothetical protein
MSGRVRVANYFSLECGDCTLREIDALKKRCPTLLQLSRQRIPNGRVRVTFLSYSRISTKRLRAMRTERIEP